MLPSKQRQCETLSEETSSVRLHLKKNLISFEQSCNDYSTGLINVGWQCRIKNVQQSLSAKLERVGQLYTECTYFTFKSHCHEIFNFGFHESNSPRLLFNPKLAPKIVFFFKLRKAIYSSWLITVDVDAGG